jgi:hypothetical protein
VVDRAFIPLDPPTYDTRYDNDWKERV